MTDPVLAAIRAHTPAPGPRVLALAETVRARAPAGSVAAFLFYGSGLREPDDASLMLDLYVLPWTYAGYHGRGARAALNRALPPDVSYWEVPHPDDPVGGAIRAKVSVLSLPALERRAKRALGHTFWGRFAQSCAVVAPTDEAARARAEAALAACVRTFARAAEPLMPGRVTARDFWTRALAASYRTELRAEDAEGRAAGIVDADLARYEAITAALYGAPDAGGRHAMPDARGPDRWALRALTGRPVQVARIVRTAFFFEGAADYALAKLERHSGVRLEVSERERRHPVLHAPALLRRAIKAGALR